ncbi:Protein RFT1 homolog [Seminavis robusta]|uniref:Protein RFT1 homolog n=1 Tax=Seminavis robusta TaxID=568900 RepID=A0A9N8DNP7_9STRA|nr:Protein RFT1 homolog [Seminavis robusta]|eukprot:Sro181_g078930.1 Protein RFT1 homolog (605) ;mRNA; r:2581-4395
MASTVQRLFLSIGIQDASMFSLLILPIVLGITVAVYFQMGSSAKDPPTGNEDKDKASATKDDNPQKEQHDTPTDDSSIRKAASGTVWSIAVKLLSFLCTQVSFRLLGDNIAALGQAAIQLELLLTTVLFVSREGFRLSLTKTTAENDTWNVAWLSIPVSTAAALLAFVWHMQTETAQLDQDYQWGGILYCIGAWMEGLAEPAALHCLRQLQVATRVSAEGMASLFKTFATVMALQLAPQWPICCFGVAQVVYGTVYAAFMYRKTWFQLVLFDVSQGLDGTTCYMTLLFTVQGLFKHFLTEADRIVLSTLAGSYDQGIYAMASAYGGLAARFLLQPMEEVARLLWSRVSSSSTQNNNDNNNNYRRLLQQSYVVLVKLVLYIGLVFCCLATNYTSVLLNVLAGRKWGSIPEAATVLSAFCIYTAFMAWNGMTEAFVFGVASSGGDIGRLGVMHSVVGVIFAVIAPMFVSRFDTVGVVAANCVCMALRSLYSMVFAAKYFAQEQHNNGGGEENTTTTGKMFQTLVRQMSPHPVVLVCFAVSALGSHQSLQWLESHTEVPTGSKAWFLLAARHVILGGMCFVGICAVAFPLEKEFRQSIRQLLRAKQD